MHFGLMWAPTSRSEPLDPLKKSKNGYGIKKPTLESHGSQDIHEKLWIVDLAMSKSPCCTWWQIVQFLPLFSVWAPNKWSNPLDPAQGSTIIWLNFSCWWCTILEIFVIKCETLYVQPGLLWVPQASSEPLIWFGMLKKAMGWNFSPWFAIVLEKFVKNVNHRISEMSISDLLFVLPNSLFIV